MTLNLHRALKMALAAGIGILSVGQATAAVAYRVTVNTSAVNGSSGFLDFQFNPGNASTQPATAQITGFIANGTLTGVPSISGNVSGTLPGTVTFVNSTALNEYFQGFTFGTNFSFILILSGPAIDSPNGIATAGSTFCVGLYDAMQNPILTDQTATTGCAGTVDVNLNGKTTATAFPSDAMGAPSVVTFALTTVESPYQVRYASNLAIGDSVVNIINTGDSATGPISATGTTLANGNLCYNVYTFSPDEQLISCCSCFATPNSLVSLSARNDLISNTLTPGIPTSIVIKLVATQATNAASCNAATVGTGTNLLTMGMAANGSTIHLLPVTPGLPTAGTYGVTETPFTQATMSASELARVTSLCGFIQSNGSGFGICKSCRFGGLGASAQ